jgi:uncharacterized membrane protein YdjX (TVP38/TMEM64 family)
MPSLRPLAVPVAAPAVSGRSRWWPLVAATTLGLALVVAGRSVDVGHYTGMVRNWTEALGPLGPAGYVVVYVVATSVGVPSMPFSLLAPVLFGVGGAVVVMVTASTMSAALGFLTARYMAREAIEARLAGTPAARLAALLEEHGWIVIPILRTVPIAPFVVVNYGFGLTRIGFWRYLIWSALGMIPSNVALIMGANLFYDATTKGIVSGPLLAGAVAAAGIVIAIVVVGRRARLRVPLGPKDYPPGPGS